VTYLREDGLWADYKNLSGYEIIAVAKNKKEG